MNAKSHKVELHFALKNYNNEFVGFVYDMPLAINLDFFKQFKQVFKSSFYDRWLLKLEGGLDSHKLGSFILQNNSSIFNSKSSF